MKPMKQTILLAALGCLDLITTIVLIVRHGAAEANPLMASFLTKGLFVFITAKIALLITPIAILEWGRRFSPTFVLKSCNAAIVAYVCLYGAGVIKINNGPDVSAAYGSEDPRVWQRIQATIAEKRATGRLPAVIYERERERDAAMQGQYSDLPIGAKKRIQAVNDDQLPF